MSRRADRNAEIATIAGLLVLVAAVGILAGLVTAPQIDLWYEPQVTKPAFTPPNWLFGPVWTVLYALMAVSAWLAWREAGWPRIRDGWALWAVQLVLNLAWSFLFFRLHRTGWALADIGLLFAAIGLTMRAFWPFSRLAAWLLVPYLAWVGYAGLLNFAIWRLNP